MFSPPNSVSGEIKQTDTCMTFSPQIISVGLEGEYYSEGNESGTTVKTYNEGDKEEFWCLNFVASKSELPYYKINATCKKVGIHCYIFVDDEIFTNCQFANYSQTLNNTFINYIAKEFDETIYPKVTETFGNEPDRDGDPKIFILLTEIRDSESQNPLEDILWGYFSPFTAYKLMKKDIITIDAIIDNPLCIPPNIAHEFQHLIHSKKYVDEFGEISITRENEESWIDEGCSLYAEYICYGIAPLETRITLFLNDPDKPLVTSGIINYGAQFLFILYLSEKYGDLAGKTGFLKDLMNCSDVGIEGIMKTLSRYGYEVNFEDIFENWILANYFGSNNAVNRLYRYDTIGLPRINATQRIYPYTINKLKPVIGNVNVWAADYIEIEVSSIEEESGVEMDFQGEENLFGYVHSNYITKLIFFNSTYSEGFIIDLVDNHKGKLIITNIGEYNKIVAVIGCTGHYSLGLTGGNGGYTFRLNTACYVDVILDIDRSGSMWGSKLREAKNAAEMFIDNLEPPIALPFPQPSPYSSGYPRDRIGLVSFATSASLDLQLTGSFDLAKSIIEGYSAAGTTNIGDALNKSIVELKMNGRKYAIWGIVFYTNGQTNTGLTKQEILNKLVPQAAEAGIKIYTCGYGTDADSNFLKKLAEGTGGKYYFAPDAGALKRIYIELSHRVKGYQQLASFSGVISQGENKTTTLFVPSDVKYLKLILSWPGSDLDLILIDPAGNYVNPGAGVIYSGIKTNPEYYEIYDPIPGNWIIQIYGKDVPYPTEYYVAVFKPGALMKLKPAVWNGCYPVNNTIIFTVSEVGGMVDLTQVTFIASDLVHSSGSFIIPASCFSFYPNNFTVGAGGSVDVVATLLPPKGIPTGMYSGTIKVISNAGVLTIFVTFKIERPIISATVEINPETLNLKSEGRWITAYIELPEDFNVNDIDVSSILLNQTIPVDLKAPVEIEDYNNNGIMDLMVKFDRKAMCNLISRGLKLDHVTLTITGRLYDETLFSGSDTVKVITSKK